MSHRLEWRLLEFLLERRYKQDELLATKGKYKYGGTHHYEFRNLDVEMKPAKTTGEKL